MPAIEKGEIHNDNGGYSSVYLAQRSIYKPEGDLSGVVSLTRKKPFDEICIKEIVVQVDHTESEKEYIEEINAILYEAYLHALIDITLQKAGLSRAVPHLHEVVALSTTGARAIHPNEIDAIWMTMEFMNGCTLEKYLQRKFASGTKESNTEILRDVLIQVANILQILQSKLLFNHRDLKLNNLYVRYHDDATWTHKINVAGLGEHTCTLDIVMIDFGFSCIACGSGFVNPRATLLGAGSYFRSEHDCLKKGRDLAQLLYSLHCSFPLQNIVTRDFFNVIHGAMKAERRSTGTTYDLFMGLDAVGTPLICGTLPKSIKYNNGIYIFLRDNLIDVPGCEPSIFLRALSMRVR